MSTCRNCCTDINEGGWYCPDCLEEFRKIAFGEKEEDKE